MNLRERIIAAVLGIFTLSGGHEREQPPRTENLCSMSSSTDQEQKEEDIEQPLEEVLNDPVIYSTLQLMACDTRTTNHELGGNLCLTTNTLYRISNYFAKYQPLREEESVEKRMDDITSLISDLYSDDPCAQQEKLWRERGDAFKAALKAHDYAILRTLYNTEITLWYRPVSGPECSDGLLVHVHDNNTPPSGYDLCNSRRSPEEKHLVVSFDRQHMQMQFYLYQNGIVTSIGSVYNVVCRDANVARGQ